MNISLEKLELELNSIVSNYMFEIISIPKLNKLKQEITLLFNFYNYEPDKYVYIYVQNGNVNINLTNEDYEPEILYTNNRFEDLQSILNRQLNNLINT